MVNPPIRTRGVKVLKAVSSPLRLQILNLLFDKNALSYTELMNSLKMNPSRDAGRFAYHLKFLLKASLVEADVESKKYFLTDLGKMVLDVSDRIEKKAFKPKGMLVRTSHLTLEEFDGNKIANSLIAEAKVPAELAQKAAKEAEKRLLKSKTKYLTASLIREVVNGILVEKGYEDYRNKLTRVGMPIHEVASLIENRELVKESTTILSRAGQAIIGEYTLLNMFPRDIADAHLSGAIYLDGLGTWILKPNEVVHDMRFFFQDGIIFDDPHEYSIQPPHSFESALAVMFNVLLHSSKEVNHMQTCNYFNVFLAPYVKGLNPQQIKENLRLFLLNLSQHVQVTLGLELSIPKLTGEKAAIGPEGKPVGKYSDYTSESMLLADLAIELMTEESRIKPLYNPTLVLKINSNTLADEKAKSLLLKAHSLAARNGMPYFANMVETETEYTAFSATGVNFSPDLTNDWETDILRTGCLGFVTINLPRIVQESNKEKNKFFEILRERCELAARALEIKYNALKKYGSSTLPFLLKNTKGDAYYRLENCSRLINFAGLNEATESFTGKTGVIEENRKFFEEVIQEIQAFKIVIGRRLGKRLYPAIISTAEAAESLARLDIEKYGIAKIKYSGTRDKPYYSTIIRLQMNDEILKFSAEDLQVGRRHKGFKSCFICAIELPETEFTPEMLMNFTQRLTENHTINLFTYSRAISYCDNCKKSWFGNLHKCPTCGSMNAVSKFDRFDSI